MATDVGGKMKPRVGNWIGVTVATDDVVGTTLSGSSVRVAAAPVLVGSSVKSTTSAGAAPRLHAPSIMRLMIAVIKNNILAHLILGAITFPFKNCGKIAYTYYSQSRG